MGKRKNAHPLMQLRGGAKSRGKNEKGGIEKGALKEKEGELGGKDGGCRPKNTRASHRPTTQGKQKTGGLGGRLHRGFGQTWEIRSDTRVGSAVATELFGKKRQKKVRGGESTKGKTPTFRGACTHVRGVCCNERQPGYVKAPLRVGLRGTSRPQACWRPEMGSPNDLVVKFHQKNRPWFKASTLKGQRTFFEKGEREAVM